ncbi:hypothetical protein B0T22DRAFT_532275 [Podospora appendiculata]|uniref:Uncharacterized protein n=1 Tax=Podospora appendiculata TaxID=314037 RepID=A0AAE1CFQ1_9PEZI|nr:hypothetical protein B0T22DRAFT_532275 [Podospora appendiculata]
MAPKKAPKKAPRKLAKPSQVIELSSDSESGGVSENETQAKPSLQEDFGDQPLLRAQGIKYKTEQSPKPTPEKLPVRVKQTGSAKHRHVSIEILLPSSSMRARDSEVADSEDEVFKTPMERKHVKFDDSDHDEFVTPTEVPSKDPMSAIRPAQSRGKEEETAESDDEDEEEEEEEEEDSDDEAPEAVSTHAAEAQLNKAAQAVAKVAERQAVVQKRKRQERDAFLKQQAEERKTAQKAPEEEEAEERPSEHPEKRKRDLPKLLPLELLDSDEEDDGDDSDATDDGNSKRRRVDAAERKLALAPKTPKDARVGSTVFRVAKSRGDQKLAPRRQLQSLNAKEELLRRNRKPQAKSGFFVR